MEDWSSQLGINFSKQLVPFENTCRISITSGLLFRETLKESALADVI